MIRYVIMVFLELVRSWEFILAALFLTVAIPFVFYVASFQPEKKEKPGKSIAAKLKKAQKKAKQVDTAVKEDHENEDDDEKD